MTQKQEIVAHLYEFGSITPLDALKEYGIMRLASRMSDLKADGFPFHTVMEKSRNRKGKTVHYARYVLGGKDVSHMQ